MLHRNHLSSVVGTEHLRPHHATLAIFVIYVTEEFLMFQTVPFNMNFPRGIYDKLMLTIRGQIKPDAKM